MKFKLSTQQVQKQILSPAMQQSIEVLLLPAVELNTTIEAELQSNPLLEQVEEKERNDLDSIEERLLESLTKERDDRSLTYVSQYSDDDIIEEKPHAHEACLEDFLLSQLRMELTDPLHVRIGEQIIGNLSEDGYFTGTCRDIAEACGLEDQEVVHDVLKTIQRFEPNGIASRSLQECLTIQLRCVDHPLKDLTHKIILIHFDMLGNRRFRELAQICKVPLETIKDVAKLVSSLEPKPARNYRAVNKNIYVTPDVVVRFDGNECRIEVNKSDTPALRISPYYRNLLTQPNLEKDAKHFIHEKLKNAVQFLKSIEQRDMTIRQIAECIVERQKAFFTQNSMSIAPMTMKEVAETIGRNESTVSRAISSKYIDTPQGLFPLKYFFSQEVRSIDGPVSSRSIKEEIKDLIGDEDRSSPWSDQRLVEHFQKRGLPIARRTISKYRQSLRILPSHLRKN